MLSEDKVKYCMKIKIKKILYEITSLWNLKHRHRHTHTAELIGTENRLAIVRISGDGGGSLRRCSTRTNLQLNYSWGCNVQHDDYSLKFKKKDVTI